jgi:polysaccharide pyruvyl transferase CsaB
MPVTLARRPRTPLICGYYGEHNLGDDALLQVLLEQLPSDWRPVVTAHDQPGVGQLHGVTTTERRSLSGVLGALSRCDSLVLGGGSLLQDSTSFRSLVYYASLILTARLQGKPVLLWGQGLGPLQRRSSRALVRLLLPQATAISWRDRASATLAEGWGIHAMVGSDPVWALPPLEWQGPGGPIVLCWRPVAQLEGEAWRPYLAAVEQLATDADREVLWLPFHRHQDGGLLAALAGKGLVGAGLRARSRELAAADPREAMALFRRAGLVIAMRLHGLILAALSGSPCAALSYDPKVMAAATGIGCPCHDLATPAPASLLARWRATLDQPPDPQRLAAERQRATLHRGVFEGLQGPRPASVS